MIVSSFTPNDSVNPVLAFSPNVDFAAKVSASVISASRRVCCAP